MFVDSSELSWTGVRVLHRNKLEIMSRQPHASREEGAVRLQSRFHVKITAYFHVKVTREWRQQLGAHARFDCRPQFIPSLHLLHP